MHVPFENLSADSKIWIYQSSRKLSEEEKDFIIFNTEAFLDEWTAHGNSLHAGVKVEHDQFIIVGVNENANEASGCSIDKQVHFMQEVSKRLDLNLLERSKVAILGEAEIQLVDFSEIKKQVTEGLINPSDKVFDNSIVSKGDLDNKWVTPASQSWIKRYF